MSRKVIEIHGMSPKDSLYGEPIRMSDGRIMQTILEVYPPALGSEEPITELCVNIDDTSVRYSEGEVIELGDGNFQMGASRIMSAVRDDMNFTHGQPRPLELSE